MSCEVLIKLLIRLLINVIPANSEHLTSAKHYVSRLDALSHFRQQPYEAGTNIGPILQMRNLRLKAIKKFAQLI